MGRLIAGTGQVSAAMAPTGHHGGWLRLAPRLAWGLALVAVALGLATSVLVWLTGTRWLRLSLATPRSGT